MRQGNGTDILGPNDPRSAGIGIIYVAPNDDRQSVLAAILTQEKLGRKIVMVNLPDQNKAFQRPADFDSLKSMRRKLQSQIVFIAPSGPGPAEFARQRRFPVYSSLESYAAELRGQGQAQQGEKKGGWSFGRKQKPADVTPPTSVARRPQTRPLAPISMVPLGQNSDDDDTEKEDEQTAPNGGAAVAGAAAGVAAGVAMSRLAADDDDTIAPPSHEDDGWDTLPPAGSAPQVVNSSPPDSVPGQEAPQTQSAGPTDDNEGTAPGPNIIELPQPRNNGESEPTPVVLPVPAAQPTPPPVNATPRRRTSGQMAAVGGVGMAAGAAGAGMARRASGGLGGSPPARTGLGGRGAPGAGGPRRRSGWRWLLAIALILLTLFLIFMGIAYAAPGVFGLTGVLPGTSPTATVMITPAHKDLKNTYVITGVTGTPNASQRQVQARLLTSAPPSQSKTVNATGVKQTQATQAKGMLTFFNAATFSQTIAVGTDITSASGVHVANDTLAIIPAAHPPTEGTVTVPAHALQAGTAGNIKALDVNQLCCVNGVSVQNTTAFTGGQDPQNYTFVQQGDINGAANPLVRPLMQSAQTDLQKQIHLGEKLVSSPQCTSNVTSDHVAGDKASTVTVTVSVKCTSEVYDQQGALSMGMNLLKTQAMTDPGAGYALVGNLVTGVTQATVIDTRGTVSLLVKAEGVWVYQFSDASKHQLARLIAGKSKKDAQAILLKQTGVSQVNIAISAGGTTLPTDSGQITILVQNVPGLSGTATPATGPSTPTTPGSTPSPSRGTQTPVVGGGG